MEIRRLFPDAETLEAARALDDLRLGDAAPHDRPCVVANMVASADGRATLDGASAGLSGPADRVLFHALRGQVDAVLAGTGTLRTERYRRLIREPHRRAERRARGLQPDALRRVRAEHGVRSLLCEGGASLLGSLLAAGLFDELFLALSPLLAGGDG